jgi:hypothetical protein
VLTAAQVNTYLNEQTVMVFASSAARTSALSGVLAEGMMSYLQDTNAVEVYNGSSWVNVGNAGDITEVQAGVGISIASGTGPIPVITNSSTDLITTAGDILYGTAADTVARLGIGTAGQVLKVNSGANAPEWGAAGGGSNVKIHYAEPVNNFTSSSGSLVDITGLTITFTPTSATNNILIFADITADYNGQGNFRLLLDGTTKAIRYFHTSSNVSTSEQLIFRTENLSASSHTYKLQTNPNSSTITVYGSSSGIVSNLTIVEIY